VRYQNVQSSRGIDIDVINADRILGNNPKGRELVQAFRIEAPRATGRSEQRMKFTVDLQPVAQRQRRISDKRPATGRLDAPMRLPGRIGRLINDDSRRRRTQKLLPTVK
jgi:hypothetical protein